MILAGDIGGTKTMLALYRVVSGKLIQTDEAVFQNRAYTGLDPILARFLEGKQKISILCLGVAAPVCNGQPSQMTNLSWVIDGAKLTRQFGIPVHLLNDLEATARGMLFLPESDKVVINKGMTQKGNIAVIAAGTGLGEALLVWNGEEYLPVASEGGHVDFAPRSDREIALLRFLRLEYGRVSYERVISGPGVFNIYRFLRDTGFAREPEELKKALAEGDPSATITEKGLAGEYALCVETLDWFVSLYGAEAGNLALKGYTTGGVYMGGGIASKILEKLKDGTFMRGFIEKGRYTDLMRAIPVTIWINPRASLIGAAYYALKIMNTKRL